MLDKLLPTTMRSRISLPPCAGRVLPLPMDSRWPSENVWDWYDQQTWLVGCNFLPSTAINQLEMFQPDDYDANRQTLVRELDWAADLGMNTLRVFLHDLLWSTDRDGFFRRLDDFLELCAERGIQPMLVFFDACHRPEPRPGRQPAPTPGIHNPGWAQSPSVPTLMDESRWPALEDYVSDTLARYGKDERILIWDLYNEPCNAGFDGNQSKAAQSTKLTRQVFRWARAASPSQPLTVCTWSNPEPFLTHNLEDLPEFRKHLLEAQTFAVSNSDVISFHNYSGPDSLREKIHHLESYGRPILCTEYMARTIGSNFQECLPVLKEKRVGAYNWGFVAGKSQTFNPWRNPEGSPEPELWFHDILRPDGTPFDPEEVKIIRKLSDA